MLNKVAQVGKLLISCPPIPALLRRQACVVDLAKAYDDLAALAERC